jgi:hypothetical protein
MCLKFESVAHARHHPPPVYAEGFNGLSVQVRRSFSEGGKRMIFALRQAQFVMEIGAGMDHAGLKPRNEGERHVSHHQGEAIS